MRHFIRFVLLIGLIHSSFAETIEAKTFQNQVQEQRYRALIDEIRCPVCQGQSIGGSNAGLAKDLREQVKVMIGSDKTDDQIRTYMTDRYGDFVVFKPPVRSSTYLLWFAPFVLLLLGVWLLIRSIKNKKVVSETSVDTAKAKELLK